jgi:hypothetical protein
MPLNVIDYEGVPFLSFQTQGNASQFIIPYAKHVCKGTGYDIGYCKEEWKLPGALGIDIGDDKGFSADVLPDEKVDYIFSSHCLEHVDNWIYTLEYWLTHIKPGGVLFLYLPDYSQTYWRPWNNRKHKGIMNPSYIKDALVSKGCKNIFISGVDLNNSFAVACETASE